MPTLDNAELRSEYIKPDTIVEDIVFQRCYFDNCSVRQAEHPEHRTIFRRVVFKNCRVWACNLDDVILEDVMVDGLRTGSGGGRIYPLKVTGARFTHVTLRGNVGGIIIAEAWSWFDHRPLWRQAFRRGLPPKTRDRLINEANRAHYASVDWALDISEANFSSSPRIVGIPAGLIRRDPRTQVVVKRAKATTMQATWRSLDVSPWESELDLELRVRPDWPEDIVLVAARRSRRFREDVAGLERLREAGVAEPN